MNDRLKKLIYYLVGFIIPKKVDFIFIVTTGRTGSSIFVKLLKKTFDLAVFPNEGNDLWHKSMYPYDPKNNFKPYFMDQKEFIENSKSHWKVNHLKRVKNIFKGYSILKRKKVIVVKSSMIIFILEEIIQSFNNCKIIYMVRHGEPVAKSFLKKQFHKYKDLTDETDFLDSNRKMWNSSQVQINKLIEEKILNKKNYMFFKYENFCESPKQIISDISKFLDLKILSNSSFGLIHSRNLKKEISHPLLEQGLNYFNYN